jgi:hypothetical protein
VKIATRESPFTKNATRRIRFVRDAGGSLQFGCCIAATFAAITAAHYNLFLSRTTSFRTGRSPAGACDSKHPAGLAQPPTVASGNNARRRMASAARQASYGALLRAHTCEAVRPHFDCIISIGARWSDRQEQNQASRL